MQNWYVLYTKPRNEKIVATKLMELGIETYCPMLSATHQWSDRKKTVTTPLIASCIFVNAKESERKMVFQVPGAVRYLYWLGLPAIVNNAEIETMQAWLKGKITEAKVEKLQPGELYIIREGAFKGLEGMVQEVNNNRLQLILEGLGIKMTITRQSVNA